MKRRLPDIAEAESIVDALKQRLPRDLTGYDRSAWVISQLLAQGRRPTNEMIRAVLGQGSPNTIKEHADEYFRRNSAKSAAPSNAIDVLLRRHFQDVYDLVRVQVEGDFVRREAALVEQRRAIAVQEAAVQALATAAEERERGAQQAVEGMRAQMETMRDELHGLQSRLGTFQDQLVREQAEKATLRERLDESERQRAAAARAQDIAITRARREERAESEQQRAALQRALDTLRAEQVEALATRDTRIARLEADLRAAIANEKIARADATRWHGAHRTLEQQHQLLQRAHSALANRMASSPATPKKAATPKARKPEKARRP